MPGPISTNAQFNQVGHDNILRDIEQLYLLIPQSTGDLGKQPIQTSDLSANGANKQNGLGAQTGTSGTTVHYLGTLDLPIFGGSNSVAGNAAGQFAVDWQQVRSISTQVASGDYSIISGGRNNIASGQDSVSIGSYNTASGQQSFCFGVSNSAGTTSSFMVGYGNSVAVSAGTPQNAYAFGAFNVCTGQTAGFAVGKSIYIDTVNLGARCMQIGFGASTSGKFICNAGGDQIFIGGISSSFTSINGNMVFIGINGTAYPGTMADGSISLMNAVYTTFTMTVRGGFGCNLKAAQTAATVNVALSAAGGFYSQAYTQLQSDLINQIRTALVNNGICI